jgi:thiamine-phosphate pyrophosphorylase
MIPKLQYLSQQTPDRTHLQAVEEACLAGCRWVQLRVKNTTFEAYLRIARQAKEVCDQYGARLTINDNLTVAWEVKAYGVHLGKEDMPAEQARRVVGNTMIIGGTANTFEDIQRLAAAKVDYIGLGPFRFTPTKEKLSPALGLEGYQTILRKVRTAGIEVPILAIGGILLGDADALLETGVYGVAVSGLITHTPDKKRIVDQLQERLQHATITNSR